jgi:small subunit ribosomal protein S8
MQMNDPIGDLIARINNAQMRKKPKVSTPGSRLRVSVLEVLQNEGYIRGYTKVDHSDGRSELEIELKYFDNEPATCRASTTAWALRSCRRPRA